MKWSWHGMTGAAKSGVILAFTAVAASVYLLAAPKPWTIPRPDGPFVPFEYFTSVYGWWSGLIVLAGVIVLWLTRSWWTQPHEIPALPTRSRPRWFWPLVWAAMLLTAVMGSMRLGQDLWDDERRTVQQFVLGDYRLKDDGGVRFREFGWGRPIFNYREVNNHILNSIFARLSSDIWKIFRPSDSPPFSEIAIRIPALIFGTLSIMTLALLLAELGMPRAGVMGAFLLAIHPWHIRYASEARGYAIVLCLIPLLAVLWMRAMRAPRWRWWIGMATCEFGLLYAYPVTIYPVAALNILTVLFVAAGVPGTVPRGVIMRRWLVTSFVSGLAFTALFLPCVPQMSTYLASERATGPMGGWWLRDFFSHLFTGAAWFTSENPSGVHPELFAMFAKWPHLGPVLAWVAAVLGFTGVIRVCSRGWMATGTAAFLLLPAVAAYLTAARSGHFMYVWYLIYVLPGTIAMIAAGFDTMIRPRRGCAGANWVLAALVIAFGASYWVVTSKARNWLLTTPLQPMRASVLLTRPTTLPNYPGHNDVITASFNTPPGLYDPHVRRIESRDDLEQLMHESDRRKAPLFINIGNPWAAAHHHPELFRMTTKEPYFQEIATLPGFDPTLDRTVTRYIPDSLPQAGRMP